MALIFMSMISWYEKKACFSFPFSIHDTSIPSLCFLLPLICSMILGKMTRRDINFCILTTSSGAGHGNPGKIETYMPKRP